MRSPPGDSRPRHPDPEKGTRPGSRAGGDRASSHAAASSAAVAGYFLLSITACSPVASASSSMWRDL